MRTLIAFFEIPVVNFDRAVAFYGKVFQMDLPQLNSVTEKMALFKEESGKCIGVISLAPDFKPSPDGVLISFAVTDMDDTILRIEEQGGRLIKPKTKIDSKEGGFFSLFADVEGNRLGLYSKA